MRTIITICLAFFSVLYVNAGDLIKVSVELNWASSQKMIDKPDGTQLYAPDFTGAVHWEENGYLPLYTRVVDLKDAGDVTVTLYNKVYAPVGMTKGLPKLPEDVEATYHIVYTKKKPQAIVKLIPLRQNPLTGQWEKLVSFDMMVTAEATANGVGSANKNSATGGYAANSVLSEGDWYKISVQQTGMTKIDYQFLKDMGFDVDNTDPRKIKLYGNGGGVLPEENGVFRHDDLVQNPIIIIGEQDGKFDQGDYIIFYAEGPSKWLQIPDSNSFYFDLNPYADKNYYFLTASPIHSLTNGLRVQTGAAAGTANQSTTTFDDYAGHELEQSNLIKSGREFFGDYFNFSSTSHTFSFNFPNMVTSEPVRLRTYLAGRSTNANINFVVSANGQQVAGISMGTVGTTYTDTYAQRNDYVSWFSSNSGSINVSVGMSTTSTSAEGWLNFIELNARRNLTYSGSQLFFRDLRTVGSGNITEFILSGGSSNVRIWDVTDATNATAIPFTYGGGQMRFTAATDELKEFVAFQDNGSFLAPVDALKLANQNLHAVGQPDMIIITVADLMSEANRLADHHRSHNNLSVLVTDVALIYNEFSSGRLDVSAVRDFVKMIYDRAGTTVDDLPRYLLLFGDGSVDYKNIEGANTVNVPIYETHESLNPITSYCTDDFFGFLDNGEGANIEAQMSMDIAIGRLPVKNLTEAANMVDKIIHYQSNSSFGSWRNNLSFIGDDEDNNTHLNDSRTVINQVEGMVPVYNMDKIFLDAYKQVSTPGGSRYPDVKDDINRRIFTGALLMDYVGHGGTNGWSHERIIDLDDIRSWDNWDKLTLFITATCEFTRIDDPAKVSAGEEVMLNKKGGGIGLISTTRLVYSYANLQTNTAVTKYLFTSFDGTRMPTLGEAVLKSKNELSQSSSSAQNARKFLLVGDPAVTLAYPKHNVVTTEINGNPVGLGDTLKALDNVTISGEVRDAGGNVMTGFNGTVYATIYDKPSQVKTLKNDATSKLDSFYVQKNIIFRGRASVQNGEFSFNFIVPIDISFAFGNGKISYYAENGIEDASGYTDSVVIGGTTDSIIPDEDGPTVGVFMNDLYFQFGGITDENPLLLVKLQDFSGINTAGNSVGHDITAVIDGNTSNTLVLNDYYEASSNNYKEGEVRFPLSAIPPGTHTVKIKAWDVYNNSAEGYTEFVVAEAKEGLALAQVLNYPNPLVTGTNFSFEHNKAGETLFVEVKIFNASGQLVKTISEQMYSGGYKVNNLFWDGTSDGGTELGHGIYVYKVVVTTSDGEQAGDFEKLVILR